MTEAPDNRERHTAVWTGSEMIRWGGDNGGFLNTGGRYSAQPTLPATPTPRPTVTPRDLGLRLPPARLRRSEGPVI
jgi:hypothetical protein